MTKAGNDSGAKPCPYCAGEKELALDWNNDWVMIQNGNVLSGADFDVEIRFCPMCGRNLVSGKGK